MSHVACFMTTPIVEIKNLSVVYDAGQPNEARALKDVTLDIYPGEYVVFFGPSGCGKSTLLYTIAGLEYPTAGTVRVVGKDLGHLAPRQLEEFHLNTIGMVFQAYYLIPSLTVLDNTLLPQLFRRATLAARRAQALKALKMFGVDDLADRLPKQLSGGQQQRVAIARALVNDPPLLLADEPTGNLDSKSTLAVVKLLYTLNEEQKRTVILVTHDPAHVGFAHRVFYMKDGLITKVVRNEHRGEVLKKLQAGVIQGEVPEDGREAGDSRFLVDFLTSPYDYESLVRLERLVAQRLQGHLTRAQFKAELAKGLAEEGIKITLEKAELLTERLEELLTERAIVREQETLPLPEQKDVEPLDIQTQFVLNAVLTGFHGALDTPELSRLRRFIRLILAHKISSEQFFGYLRRGIEKGGIGLSIASARYVASRVGLLVANSEPA